MSGRRVIYYDRLLPGSFRLRNPKNNINNVASVSSSLSCIAGTAAGEGRNERMTISRRIFENLPHKAAVPAKSTAKWKTLVDIFKPTRPAVWPEPLLDDSELGPTLVMPSPPLRKALCSYLNLRNKMYYSMYTNFVLRARYRFIKYMTIMSYFCNHDRPIK